MWGRGTLPSRQADTPILSDGGTPRLGLDGGTPLSRLDGGIPYPPPPHWDYMEVTPIRTGWVYRLQDGVGDGGPPPPHQEWVAVGQVVP